MGSEAESGVLLAYIAIRELEILLFCILILLHVTCSILFNFCLVRYASSVSPGAQYIHPKTPRFSGASGFLTSKPSSSKALPGPIRMHNIVVLPPGQGAVALLLWQHSLSSSKIGTFRDAFPLQQQQINKVEWNSYLDKRRKLRERKPIACKVHDASEVRREVTEKQEERY
jgi:hypothetical protein